MLIEDGRIVELAEPGKLSAQSRRDARRQGIDRRSRLHRSARAPARAGTGAQGNHRQRHGGSGGRRIHLGLRHAEHRAGERLCRRLRAGCRMPERGAVVNVFPIAAATRGSQGEKLTDYCELKARRRRGGERRWHGRFSMTTSCARRWRWRTKLGMPVIQHAEDTTHLARQSDARGSDCVPPGTARAARGARVADGGARRYAGAARQRRTLHVAHVSTAESLDVVR